MANFSPYKRFGSSSRVNAVKAARQSENERALPLPTFPYRIEILYYLCRILRKAKSNYMAGKWAKCPGHPFLNSLDPLASASWVPNYRENFDLNPTDAVCRLLPPTQTFSGVRHAFLPYERLLKRVVKKIPFLFANIRWSSSADYRRTNRRCWQVKHDVQAR